MTEKRRAMLCMVLCAALWSTAGAFTKSVRWDAFTVSCFRSLFAAAAIFFYIRAKGLRLTFNKSSFLAGFCYAATGISYLYAIKVTTAANAIALQFTAPMFVMALSSLFYKQRFKKADIVTVIAVLAGVTLFFYEKMSMEGLVGNISAIFSGLAIAAMYVVTNKSGEESRMSGILIGNLMTVIVCAPFIFTGSFEFGLRPFLLVAAMGIFQLGLPYMLYNTASKRCSALSCSLFSAVEPLLSPVWAFIFVGEIPGVLAVTGGLVIVASISLWCVWTEKTQSKN